jgi:hypothetical protein
MSNNDDFEDIESKKNKAMGFSPIEPIPDQQVSDDYPDLEEQE